MAAPHNSNRYGEEWPLNKIHDTIRELSLIKEKVILTGGWAWHFISPPHTEYKHLHDHKDVDIFVRPSDLLFVITELKSQGFVKTPTRYDSNFFQRYTKEQNKTIIDLFIRSLVPYIQVKGWYVVDPQYLITLYTEKIHQSSNCIAVIEALNLLPRGISPVDRQELITLPERILSE